MSATHDALEEARGYMISMHDTIHIEAKIDTCIFCDSDMYLGQRARAHMGIDDWTPAMTEPPPVGKTFSIDVKAWNEEEPRLPAQDSDFREALPLADAPFHADDVTQMHACVAGENEEYHWYWVVRVGMHDAARWYLVEGWCDYTGWDCRAGADVDGPHLSALMAANKAPVLDSRDRPIIANLMNQIVGKQPYALYIEEVTAL